LLLGQVQFAAGPGSFCCWARFSLLLGQVQFATGPGSVCCWARFILLLGQAQFAAGLGSVCCWARFFLLLGQVQFAAGPGSFCCWARFSLLMSMLVAACCRCRYSGVRAACKVSVFIVGKAEQYLNINEFHFGNNSLGGGGFCLGIRLISCS
jgi:hypothetical protein